MYTINFPAIAPSAAHNFSVKTIEFKMSAVSVKRSIVWFVLKRIILSIHPELNLILPGFDKVHQRQQICARENTLFRLWQFREICLYDKNNRTESLKMQLVRKVGEESWRGKLAKFGEI